jgi:division protein CdvB (Snf7/Vps24/ESCRT-III family)
MSKDTFNDFGFTSVTLDELDDYQEAKSQVDGATAENAVILERIDKLYNAFLPLLSNLKKDAGKDYILWPNRLEKIEEFEEVLYNIYSGK